MLLSLPDLAPSQIEDHLGRAPPPLPLRPSREQQQAQHHHPRYGHTRGVVPYSLQELGAGAAGYGPSLLLQFARLELLLDSVDSLAHLGAGLFDLGPGSRHLIALASTLLCLLARRGSRLWRTFLLLLGATVSQLVWSLSHSLSSCRVSTVSRGVGS